MSAKSLKALKSTKSVLCYVVAAMLSSTALAASITYPGASAAADGASVALSRNVVPVSYVINLAPDVDTMRVAGTESVKLNVIEATDIIRFNSSGQRLSHVLIDGATVESFSSSESGQNTTVRLKAAVAPGEHTLSFSFVGRIGGKAGLERGMFTQPYTSQYGGHDYFLTTVFENKGARAIFPCWDDPSFKASYQLSITAPTAWDIWSSLSVDQREVRGAMTTVSFRPTSDIGSELVEFSKVHKIVSPERYIGSK
jgi:aminopeptidase N